MTDTPTRPRPRRPRAALLLLLLVVAPVGAYLGGLFDAPPSGPDAPFVFRGRVIDAAGAPAVGAGVRCDWRATYGPDAADQAAGTSRGRTDEDGRYVLAWSVVEDPEKAKKVSIEVALRASGPRGSTEPSAEQAMTFADRADVDVTIQLGATLPTVPLHVKDRQGRPVTGFSGQVVPLDKMLRNYELPSVRGESADGVAALPVPAFPFRVEVQLEGGARKAAVGPFAPGELPAQIDVTLPDA